MICYRLKTWHYELPAVGTRVQKHVSDMSSIRIKGKKLKGKVHLTAGHEIPEVEWRCSSTLSLTLPLDGVDGQRYASATLTTGTTWYPLCRRLLGPQGPVWTGLENLAHTGIRSPDHPARSESLYRLSYPGPICIYNK
jgi:hypothetical protein